MQPKLLIIEDEPAWRLTMSRYLSRSGMTVREAGSLRAARSSLAADRYDAILLDLRLPDGDGLDWIDEIRRKHKPAVLIVVTGTDDVPVAVEAMRRGAHDFVTKPVDPEKLLTRLRRFLDADGHQPRPLGADDDSLFFGTSAAASELRELAGLAASSDAVTLITGETGAGKGVLGRWIHDHSARKAKAFVELNCSGLRAELLANELFGHARGAFTSATEPQPGLLDVADGGTLFLDEIGDMDLGIQAQFLKTIEEKRYRRLGDVNARNSDFRLICATNHTLEDEVAASRFRRDLFYRLSVLRIHVPPLRELLSDLRSLASKLLAMMPGAPPIDDDALEALEAHDWPGNIRELRNALERGALRARAHGRIRAVDVQPLQRVRTSPQFIDDVVAALQRHDGDKERTALSLGISRATLYRRLSHARLTETRMSEKTASATTD